jgi:hypothetical protein
LTDEHVFDMITPSPREQASKAPLHQSNKEGTPMGVDARRRYDLHAELEPALGESAADLMEFLRELSERPDLQRRNYERLRREPEQAYGLHAAVRRKVGRDAAATLMEILDPIGWAEEWPAAATTTPTDGDQVAASSNRGDHGAR